MAITGTHALLYTSEPDAVRAILRDLLGLGHVDAGDGWLIMKLPPAEVGVHPTAPGETHHELSFLCDDIGATMAELRAKGLEFDREPEDRRYGLVSFLVLPGDLKVQVYQPHHEVAAHL
ncbi:MAG: VOC family protein [Acidimicrobiales bacterium]